MSEVDVNAAFRVWPTAPLTLVRHRFVHVAARVSAEQLRGQRGPQFGVLDVAGVFLSMPIAARTIVIRSSNSALG